MEYDGTDYHGFQIQPHVVTVQGVLQDALARVAGQGEPVKLSFAGRTDAGVHASGQVIAFATSSRLPCAQFVRAANSLLPPSIALRSAEEADPSFDPRRDALARTYRYTFLDGPAPSPLLARYSYHLHRALDVECIRAACAALEGCHDFAAFGHDPGEEGRAATGAAPNTVRTVYRARCWRQGERVVLEVTANAFLRTMMRRLAGTLARVGLGKLAAQDVADQLAGRATPDTGPSAPARGLCLTAVAYEQKCGKENACR